MSKPALQVVSEGRVPKQDRSRASFERVIAAATQILRERGHADFTLAEVSRRSKVSIGSIYCRIDSKEELARIVQQRVFEQLDREYADVINRIRRRGLSLREMVPVYVEDLATLLREYGNIFAAMIEMASSDPKIEASGKQHYAEQCLDFQLLLLERRAEIRHPEPEHAAVFVFSMVYGMIGRHLGFGSGDAVGEGNWQQLVDDLATAALALLLMPPEERRASAR